MRHTWQSWATNLTKGKQKPNRTKTEITLRISMFKSY